MKLTFVSNYINHHQIPVSNVLYRELGANYHFIQTEPMEAERIAMGWKVQPGTLPYLKYWYEEPQACERLVMESDVVIFGGVEEEAYISARLSSGKPVIRYSERLYREGQWKAISPRGLFKKYHDHTRYRRKNVYLLCSGAYVASDFSLVRAYPGKMLKWGYFTECRHYDVKALIRGKAGAAEGVPELLFAGRFLPLKHPEYAIELARRLKEQGLSFHLTMVGGGELERHLQELTKRYGLEESVTFAGYQKPESVRAYMERADVFLMTSNYLEGWGAVLNEAMNSGCALIADAKIGAVPFLLIHEENGLVYRDGDLEEFLRYGERLVRDGGLRSRLGKAAYETIESLWNPEFAALSLLRFAEGICRGAFLTNERGPLSKALVISPRKGYAYTRSGKQR